MIIVRPVLTVLLSVLAHGATVSQWSFVSPVGT
jgi:hypothetical protein